MFIGVTQIVAVCPGQAGYAAFTVSGMEIYLPKAVRKKKRGIPLAKVALRWRVRAAHARWLLEQAGVEVIPVEPEPVPGISMRDLLKYESNVRRAQLEAIANDPSSSEDNQQCARHDLGVEFSTP